MTLFHTFLVNFAKCLVTLLTSTKHHTYPKKVMQEMNVAKNSGNTAGPTLNLSLSVTFHLVNNVRMVVLCRSRTRVRLLSCKKYV